jgi:hypothetical protein
MNVLISIALAVGAFFLMGIFVAPVIMGMVATVRYLGKWVGPLLILAPPLLAGYYNDGRIMYVYLTALGVIGLVEILNLLVNST